MSAKKKTAKAKKPADPLDVLLSSVQQLRRLVKQAVDAGVACTDYERDKIADAFVTLAKRKAGTSRARKS